MVIPAMDVIDDRLDTDSKSPSLRSSIREAARLAKKTLNRYYEKTDYSNVYRIAMVLHPNYKLMYFKNAGWETEWIDTAEELVREEFRRHYAIDGREDDTGDKDEAQESANVSPLVFMQSTLMCLQQSKNMFDNLFRVKKQDQSNVDEVTQYLETRTEDVSNAIEWWLAQRLIYPRLSRMAIDYLMIPGKVFFNILHTVHRADDLYSHIC